MELSRRTVLGSAAGGVAAAALPIPAWASTDAPWTLDDRMSTDAAWASFLGGQDLVWRKLPAAWTQGPFLGDGRLGSGSTRNRTRTPSGSPCSTAKVRTTARSSAACSGWLGCRSGT